MAACLSGRYRPSYAHVICNHGPQPRGISETLAFCIVKPCQNPTLWYNHRRFSHAVYIFIILPFCLYNTNPLYSPLTAGQCKSKNTDHYHSYPRGRKGVQMTSALAQFGSGVRRFDYHWVGHIFSQKLLSVNGEGSRTRSC